MESKNGGIGFCGVLTLIFVTLKLLDVIAWSWWWVLAPLWIPVAIVLVVILITVIIATLT